MEGNFSTWVSMQPVVGAGAGPSFAEAWRSGVASFLTWSSKVGKCVDWLCLPQGAACLPPAGCNRPEVFPLAAFCLSASTFGHPGWCSAGLWPAPTTRFWWSNRYLAKSYLQGFDWVTVSDVNVALCSLENLHLHLHLHQKAERAAALKCSLWRCINIAQLNIYLHSCICVWNQIEHQESQKIPKFELFQYVWSGWRRCQASWNFWILL